MRVEDVKEFVMPTHVDKQRGYLVPIIELFHAHWQRQLHDDNAKLPEQLRYYIPAKMGKSDNEAVANRAEGVAEISALLKSDKPALLLLGDSGAGKTLFCQFYVDMMWRYPGEWLPLFIHLPLLDLRPGFNFETYLREQCRLSFEQVEFLKINKIKLLIFFDSYDEMPDCYRGKNIYQSLELHKYTAKIVLSCRSEALVNYKLLQQRAMFTPTALGQPESIIERRFVQFFDELQIPQYIQRWQELNPAEVDGKLDYVAELKALPGIKTMIANPFILWAVMEVLPDLLAAYADHSKLQRYDLTRKALYDRFTAGWFKRQREKLLRNGDITPGEWGATIIEDFQNYCQSLASYMWETGVSSLTYEPQAALGTNQELVTSAKAAVLKPNILDRFFAKQGFYDKERKKPLSILRKGALLRVSNATTFNFLHDSLKEYFSARRMHESALHMATIPLGLEINSKLYTYDLSMIGHGIESLANSPELERILREIINESKHEPKVATAAANAITILVAAGKSFSGVDLRQVRIRGANISGGNFDGADLRDADLRGVNLSKVWLVNAKLSGACLDDIQLDESASDSFESSVRGLGFSPCGQYYVVMTLYSLFIFESATHKTIFKYAYWLKNSNRALAVSAGSNSILIGDDHGKLKLISFPNGKKLVEWEGHSKKASTLIVLKDGTIWLDHMKRRDLSIHEYVESIVLSHDGKWAWSTGADHLIKCWNCATGELLKYWDTLESLTTTLVLSKDERQVFSILDKYSYGRSIIRIWGAFSGECLSTINEGVGIFPCAIGADNSWIFANRERSSNVFIKISSITGHTRQTFNGHNDDITALVLNTDQNLAISGSRDKSIKRWDANNGECLSTWYGHSGAITALALSPDGTWVLSGSDDQTIRRWHCDVSSKVSTSLNMTNFYGDLNLCVEGSSVGLRHESGSKKRVIYTMFDCLTGELLSDSYKPLQCPCCTTTDRCVTNWEGHDDWGDKIFKMYSLDGRYTYTIKRDRKTIERYEISTNSYRQYEIGKETPDKLKLSLNGEWILRVTSHYRNVYHDFDETTEIWKLGDRECSLSWTERRVKLTDACAISPDGKWAIFADGLGSLLIRRTSHKNVVRQYSFGFHTSYLNWSSKDQSLILMGIEGKYLSAWTFQEGTATLHLRWKTHVSRCEVTDCDLLGVYGLSENSMRFFSQRGANVEVSTKSSHEILTQRQQLSLYNDSNRRRSLFDNRYILRPTFPVITVARPKSGQGFRHAVMIIESVETLDKEKGSVDKPSAYYYRIRRIEFFLELRQSILRPGTSAPNNTDLFGQGLIEISDVSSLDAEKIAQEYYHPPSEQIACQQLDQLLDAIYKDKNKALAYCKMGGSGLYRLFTPAWAVEHHNCMSWIRKHLEAIGIDLIKGSFKDFFVEDPLDKIPATGLEPTL